MVNCACICIVANQFCFETGCFVSKLDVLFTNFEHVVGGIFQTVTINQNHIK